MYTNVYLKEKPKTKPKYVEINEKLHPKLLVSLNFG